MGFLLALIYHAVPDAPEVLPKGWSSVAVLITAFPLLVPSTRGKTALATAATAFMDPIGLLVAIALGYQTAPSAAIAVAMFLPTAVAYVVAIIGSRVVYRLSAQAGKAEELGSYRLVAPIGHGGMGEVWRAEHRMLARDAAIKLVRARDGEVPRELVTRFEREAKATAGLRSPHTVELYDFGRSDAGASYYVMELLDGFTLDRLVDLLGALDPGRVVPVPRQPCRSLAEAHGADSAPRHQAGNIFLCAAASRFREGRDFAREERLGGRREPHPDRAHHRNAGVYAPEMALGKDVDGRATFNSGAWATSSSRGSRLRPKTASRRCTTTPRRRPCRPAAVATPVLADLEAVLLDTRQDPSDRPESARVLEARLASTSSAGRWSAADAELWWDRFAPATGATRTLPTGIEGTRLETPADRAAAGG